MKRSNTKAILIGVLAAALVIVLSYFIGLRQGRAELEARQTEFQKQLQTLQQQASAAENRSLLLAARLDLYRTAMDLDQRNFGLANTHLQGSAARLSRVNPAAIGVDPAKLESVHRDIAGSGIKVADNLEEQRNRILVLLSQIEALEPAASGTK
ncbi:MAG TPA: hypothetical protein PK587_02785 [Syntrophales bacterium]|nr:hypothetical protein [Syntrophales bacterium]HPL62670.1 hypothetical protein [Syntrophales bacterium]